MQRCRWLSALLWVSVFGCLRMAAAANAGGTLVISGAGGQLGAEVTRVLLQRGVPPAQLILVTRTPDRLGEFAQRGVAIRRGDFSDADSLPLAFAGGTTLLLISTDHPGPERVAMHRAAIDAARSAGIRRIVYTSIVDVGERATEAMFTDHLKTEDALRDSGLQWTVLRNQVYDDLQLNSLAAAVKLGTFNHNWGDGKVAFISRHDCAVAAAAALTSSDHENGVLNMTGPDLLSADALARVLTRMTHHTVKAADYEDDAFERQLQAAGLPPMVSQMSAQLGDAIRRGSFDVRTQDFERLVGRAPMSLEAFLRAHADALMPP